MTGLERVVWTSSRKWDRPGPVYEVLTALTFAAFDRGRRLLLVHGRCRQGGDELAYRWVSRKQAAGWPVVQDPVPADWTGPCMSRCPAGHRRQRRDGTTFCPAAGMYRNERLPTPDTVLCVALIRDRSRGATGCAAYAEKMGVPTARILWDTADPLDVINRKYDLGRHVRLGGGL